MFDTVAMIIEMLVMYTFLGLANIGTGMYYNINIKRMKFDGDKLLNGFLKIFVIGISILLGTVCIAMLPHIFRDAGIEISNMNDITTKVVFCIVGTGIVTYATKFIDNLRKIFNKNGGDDNAR